MDILVLILFGGFFFFICLLIWGFVSWFLNKTPASSGYWLAVKVPVQQSSWNMDPSLGMSSVGCVALVRRIYFEIL